MRIAASSTSMAPSTRAWCASRGHLLRSTRAVRLSYARHSYRSRKRCYGRKGERTSFQQPPPHWVSRPSKLKTPNTARSSCWRRPNVWALPRRADERRHGQRASPSCGPVQMPLSLASAMINFSCSTAGEPVCGSVTRTVRRRQRRPQHVSK